MVTLSKIYTRGGDAGQTSLGDGSRRAKHDLRVEAYGTVDEANAAIGLVRQHTTGEIDALLSRIQNDLFDLGADLCTPEGTERRSSALRVEASQVKTLEDEIDRYNASLEPLKSFILPGGTPAAANPESVKYLNRLSDLFFVLGRHVNDGGKADILWVPGANR